MSKIVFVTPSYSPQIGGVETHVSAITAQLVERGHAVTVIAAGKRDKRHRPEKLIGIQAQGLAKYEIWQQIWQLRHEFISADIVHVHDVGWWLVPVLPFVLHKLNVTFHGWEGDYPVRWQAKLHRLILALMARSTIHVGDFIQKFYWDVPELVMYGGVDEELLDTDIRPISKPINIAFFGRLEPENDLTMYLDLVKKLKQKKLNFKMIWVGDGQYRGQCEKIGQVTGMVDQPANYLEKADIVLANSFLSLLHAQAMGKICVGLYSNPLKDAYLADYPGRTAMIIDADSTEAASKLIELLKNKRRINRLQKKAQRLVANYTWKNITKQYLSLWNLEKI